VFERIENVEDIHGSGFVRTITGNRCTGRSDFETNGRGFRFD
jgi:hypothetical protein